MPQSEGDLAPAIQLGRGRDAVELIAATLVSGRKANHERPAR
jgi:hypothetical protein